MPYCAVANCKNKSNEVNMKKGNISYHHFPKDPKVKEKWINATGRKDWFPTKYSTICSSHFREEDYDTTKQIRKLYPKAYPEKEVWAQHDESSASKSNNRQSVNPKCVNNMDITTTPIINKLRIQLAHAQDVITKKNLQVKRLRELNRRKSKKILHLNETIKKFTDTQSVPALAVAGLRAADLCEVLCATEST